MQCDSLLLTRLVREAAPLLEGAVIRDCHARAQSPGLVMGLHGPPGVRGMLFSSEPRTSRWHLISKVPTRVEDAESHLSMMARQKLVGTRITRLEQPAGERVLRFTCERQDFTGDAERYFLVAELMGPYSNLLILESDETVLATGKIAHSYDNLHREVRPGKPYIDPPPAGHHAMRVLSVAEWTEFFMHQDPEAPLQAALLRTFRGLTPGLITAALEALDYETRPRIVDITEDRFGPWAATMEDLWVEAEAGTRLPPWEQWIDITLTGVAFHEAVAGMYDAWEADSRAAERAQQWQAALKAREKDLKQLRGSLFEELGRHHGNLKARRIGDLIFANLHMLDDKQRGYEHDIEIPDVYAAPPDLSAADGDDLSEEELEQLTAPGPPLITVTIPADKSPAQFARDAHHLASRGQRGIVEVQRRLGEVEALLAEIKPLSTRWQDYQESDPLRWREALNRLRKGEALPPPGRSNTTKRADPAGGPLPQALKGKNIHVYKLPDDRMAFVGGNAAANESLWRYGDPEHIWMHVKGLPGSHVLIPWPQGQLSHEVLIAGARLAVSHSSASEATKIPVDYVLVRYLKKPPGSAPGYVTYTRERTLLVDPFSALELRKLKLTS